MNRTGTQLQSRAQAERQAPTPAPDGLLKRTGVREALDAPGRPLDASTRAFVEPRLGHNFADVRVHTDERAVASARSVGARAYTVGNHVVFNSGRYAPQTAVGLHLLAHELTHVVQQQGSASAEPVALSSPEHEHEAGRVADALKSGRVPPAPVLRSGPALALEPEGGSAQPQNESPAPAAEPTQAQAEREREVEVVEVGGKPYVLYQTTVRFGKGSSSWLAKNPGNMDYTQNTVKWGCYEGKKLRWGEDHAFAIFPSEDQGMYAVRSFLVEFKGERTIRLMMDLFAPASDGNDPDSYANRVAKRIGVPVTTLVKDLNKDQIAEFAEGIKEVEGWIVGDEKPRGDASLPEEIRRRT